MSKLQSDDLSVLAYKKIKSMILANELPQGKKIVQDKLALELGISRTPLRSALQMLEAEYLVETVPRSGMIVKKFTNKEIIEVFDCRIALEGIAFRVFAESADNKKILKLKKIFEPFINNGKIDPIKYKAADVEFHDFVVRECGNSFLNSLFHKGNLLVYIDRIGLIRPPEDTLEEHMDIIQAIEKRDLDATERLAKFHLVTSRDLVVEKLKTEKAIQSLLE